MVDVSIDMDSMCAQIVTQGRWKEPEDFYRLARPTLTLFKNSLCASMWNPRRLRPFRSKRRRGSALDEGLFFSADTPKVRLRQRSIFQFRVLPLHIQWRLPNINRDLF